MKPDDLQNLLTHLPPDFGEPELIETHISQVILGNKRVYKIKKPLKYSFLDFSDLKSRRHYCQEELRLNRRLTNGVYLEVVAIRMIDGEFFPGGKEGEVVDYALCMKRLPGDRQMDLLLQADRVSPDDLQNLSAQLAGFHQTAERIDGPGNPERNRSLFDDLESVSDFLKQEGETGLAALIEKGIRTSNAYLKESGELIRQRGREGWIRDVHGDLHSRNIFLLEEPVIFDCIEFNPSFRHLDLLDEIAFFCMDLDVLGREDLAKFFCRTYFEDMQWEVSSEELRLFTWFKAYRANVRAKVNALRAMQAGGEQAKRHLEECRRYLRWMIRYLQEI